MKEPTLGNPQNTIEVLQKYNFVFQKKFGQNFLIDTHVLDHQRRCCAGDRSRNRNDDSVPCLCGKKGDRGRDR